MTSNVRAMALLLAATLSCAGCAAEISEPAALATKNPCERIDLRDYDRETMKRVAAEVQAAPAAAIWPSMLGDYGLMRAEVRACRGGGRKDPL